MMLVRPDQGVPLSRIESPVQDLLVLLIEGLMPLTVRTKVPTTTYFSTEKL